MSKGISELSRINRNIMEFKVPFSYACPYIRQGINRNIMEFKVLTTGSTTTCIRELIET